LFSYDTAQGLGFYEICFKDSKLEQMLLNFVKLNTLLERGQLIYVINFDMHTRENVR